MSRASQFLAILLAFAMAAPAVGQERNSVSPVELVHGEAPAPRIGVGAPLYSPEQTASYLCVALSTGKDIPEAQRAHAATVKAREVRINALNGAATRAQMNAAERERQEAVLKMLGDDVLDAGFRSLGALFSRGKDAVAAEQDGVIVDQIATQRVLESGRPVLNITGRARNTGKGTVELWPLAVLARDANGFMIGGQSHMLDKATLAPGEAYTFALRFKNPPAYTASIDVRFSDRFETRNFRGCDFFDPATFDPRRETLTKPADVPMAPAPKLPPGAPDYTPRDLAAVFPRLMRDAQAEFIAAREQRACPVRPEPHRQNWRALFRQADLAYEAWNATTALEETRRDAAKGPVPITELEAAERQRQIAVNAFIKARPAPLPQLSQLAPFALSASAVTIGDGVVVRGEIRNLGRSKAQPHGLLIIVNDRFGRIVSEMPRDPEPVIAPGQPAAFDIPLGLPPQTAADVQVVFRVDPPPPVRKRGQPNCAG